MCSLQTGKCPIEFYWYSAISVPALCEIPETVEHFIKVCPKFTEARRRLKHAVEDLDINFFTREILRSTAAAKHMEAFVQESGIRI